MQIVEMVQTVIYLVGIVGLAYWVRRWIYALKGAVDAQKATIDAQKVFIENLSTLLNVADTPKMLERYEGFKKIVDHEKEATLERYMQETNQVLRLQGKLMDTAIDELLAVIRGTIPYVPADKRPEIIESAKIPSGQKQILIEMAETAPDLVAQERERERELIFQRLEEQRQNIDKFLQYLQNPFLRAK